MQRSRTSFVGRVVACAQLATILLCVSLPTADAATFSSPEASRFSVSNDRPFAGDGRLLATISPNGDSVRDRASIRFTLSRPATVLVQLRSSWPETRTVFSRRQRLRAGRHAVVWAPTHDAIATTYRVRLIISGPTGSARFYDRGRASGSTPVIHVLGIEAAFAKASYAPGNRARVTIAADAPVLALQLFRSGPESVATHKDGVMRGVPVTRPWRLNWRSRRDRPATIGIRVGGWSSGFYFLRVQDGRGGVGYAPLVVRPAHLGNKRIAVVLPTYSWQAYNYRDDDGDGFADSWYGGGPEQVRLGRPYLDRGVPPHFRRYDLPFLRWLASTGREVDYLAEEDLTRLRSGDALAHAYALIVFPGHNEYVTTREYDVVQRFRDLGGNLLFLSANDFFRRVDEHDGRLSRIGQWRLLGRPEAALVGVQYVANDNGAHKGLYVVRNHDAAPWLFRGTGLRNGSRFGGFGYVGGPFGIEIDATAPSSPPTTHVLAEIPNLYREGTTAQMTYYETSAGAKVFAAGAFSLAGAALWEPTQTLLANLWNHLTQE